MALPLFYEIANFSVFHPDYGLGLLFIAYPEIRPSSLPEKQTLYSAFSSSAKDRM